MNKSAFIFVVFFQSRRLRNERIDVHAVNFSDKFYD